MRWYVKKSHINGGAHARLHRNSNGWYMAAYGDGNENSQIEWFVGEAAALLAIEFIAAIDKCLASMLIDTDWQCND